MGITKVLEGMTIDDMKRPTKSIPDAVGVPSAAALMQQQRRLLIHEQQHLQQQPAAVSQPGVFYSPAVAALASHQQRRRSRLMGPGDSELAAKAARAHSAATSSRPTAGRLNAYGGPSHRQDSQVYDTYVNDL